MTTFFRPANTLMKVFLLSVSMTAVCVGQSYADNVGAKVVPNVMAANTAAHRTENIQKVSAESTDIAKPEVAPVRANNVPNRITSTLKGATDTGRAFHWFTTDPVEDPVVLVSKRVDLGDAIEFKATARPVASHYLQRDAKGYFIYKKTKPVNGEDRVIDYFTDAGRTDVRWEPESEIAAKDEKVGIDVTKVTETVYDADVTGLEPGTRYYYRVGSRDGNLSDVGTFETAGGDNKVVTFIQYTDTQNAYYNEHKRNEAQFGADTLYRAQIVAPDADFVLHTGDIVEFAEAEDEWVDLMAQSQSGFLKHSLLVVAGNHDEYGLNTKELLPNKFSDHFNLDAAGPIDGGSYYSVDFNKAHFIVLNTNDYKNPEKKALGKEQLDWLRKDVADARKNGAEWVVLTYHKPLFSKSYHSLEDADVQNVRDDFMKAIDDLDIDLALQGHDHVFSRTKSLFYAPKDESFVNAAVENINYAFSDGNHKVLKSPKGTTFVIPNTGGTKAYDSLFDASLEHIKKVRPKLDWLTQDQLEHYNYLFEIGYQPQRSERYTESHENYRDSSAQNFAVYEIDGKTLTGEVYQVTGDLSKGEPRKVFLVDKFTIQKD